MQNLVGEFADLCLSPWQRLGRGGFGLALLAASVPGLVLMVMGFGDLIGSFLDPIMKLTDLYQASDWQGMQGMAQGLQGAQAGEEPFNLSGFVNGLCFLLVAPLCRPRLHDMGWSDRMALALTVVFNLSILEGLIQVVTGFDILPWGSVWGMLNFAGYVWLSLAKSRAAGSVYDRTQSMLEERALQDKLRQERDWNAQGMPKRDDEDYK